jgi:hypothetical protein
VLVVRLCVKQGARMTIFGVQTHVGPEPDQSAAIYNIGCRETRVDFYWRDIERLAAGDFHWDVPDGIVRKCVQAPYPLRPLPILYAPPAWACTGNNRGVPDDLSLSSVFASFCSQVANRYRAGGPFWQQNPSLPQLPIMAYEIWNEPNLWSPDPGPTYFWHGYPEEYISIFNAAANSIRAVGSATGLHLDVLIGGLAWFDAPTPPGPPYGAWNTTQYLDVLRTKGIFVPDAVGFHPYGFNATLDGSGNSAYSYTILRIKSMVNKLSQMGWNIGLDITEDGIPWFHKTPSGGFVYYAEQPDRYSYFRDTVNTIQQSYPSVRRYNAFTWIANKGWTPSDHDYNFDIAQDDGVQLLGAGEGYRDGING